MTDKEIDKIIKANIKMAGFISLVKRMREAQKDVIYKSMFSALVSVRPTAYEVAKTKQIVLEQEVDEYLKKIENTDQRKALEAENTEFDYGHNVKHYRED